VIVDSGYQFTAQVVWSEAHPGDVTVSLTAVSLDDSDTRWTEVRHVAGTKPPHVLVPRLQRHLTEMYDGLAYQLPLPF
jgi:hypothetical protein